MANSNNLVISFRSKKLRFLVLFLSTVHALYTHTVSECAEDALQRTTSDTTKSYGTSEYSTENKLVKSRDIEGSIEYHNDFRGQGFISSEGSPYIIEDSGLFINNYSSEPEKYDTFAIESKNKDSYKASSVLTEVENQNKDRDNENSYEEHNYPRIDDNDDGEIVRKNAHSYPRTDDNDDIINLSASLSGGISGKGSFTYYSSNGSEPVFVPARAGKSLIYQSGDINTTKNSNEEHIITLSTEDNLYGIDSESRLVSAEDTPKARVTHGVCGCSFAEDVSPEQIYQHTQNHHPSSYYPDNSGNIKGNHPYYNASDVTTDSAFGNNATLPSGGINLTSNGIIFPDSDIKPPSYNTIFTKDHEENQQYGLRPEAPYNTSQNHDNKNNYPPNFVNEDTENSPGAYAISSASASSQASGSLSHEVSASSSAHASFGAQTEDTPINDSSQVFAGASAHASGDFSTTANADTSAQVSGDFSATANADTSAQVSGDFSATANANASAQVSENSSATADASATVNSKPTSSNSNQRPPTIHNNIHTLENHANPLVGTGTLNHIPNHSQIPSYGSFPTQNTIGGDIHNTSSGNTHKGDNHTLVGVNFSTPENPIFTASPSANASAHATSSISTFNKLPNNNIVNSKPPTDDHKLSSNPLKPSINYTSRPVSKPLPISQSNAPNDLNPIAWGNTNVAASVGAEVSANGNSNTSASAEANSHIFTSNSPIQVIKPPTNAKPSGYKPSNTNASASAVINRPIVTSGSSTQVVKPPTNTKPSKYRPSNTNVSASAVINKPNGTSSSSTQVVKPPTNTKPSGYRPSGNKVGTSKPPTINKPPSSPIRPNLSKPLSSVTSRPTSKPLPISHDNGCQCQSCCSNQDDEDEDDEDEDDEDDEECELLTLLQETIEEVWDCVFD